MLQLRRSRRRDAPPAQIVTTARVAAARRRAALLRLVKASPFPPTLYCCSSGFVLQQCCSLQAHLPALATRLLRSYSLAAQVQPSSQENEMRRLKINQYFLLTKLNCKPYHLSLFFFGSVFSCGTILLNMVRWLFQNLVDQILTNFDLLPPSVDNCGHYT